MWSSRHRSGNRSCCARSGTCAAHARRAAPRAIARGACAAATAAATACAGAQRRRRCHVATALLCDSLAAAPNPVKRPPRLSIPIRRTTALTCATSFARSAFATECRGRARHGRHRVGALSCRGGRGGGAALAAGPAHARTRCGERTRRERACQGAARKRHRNFGFLRPVRTSSAIALVSCCCRGRIRRLLRFRCRGRRWGWQWMWQWRNGWRRRRRRRREQRSARKRDAFARILRAGCHTHSLADGCGKRQACATAAGGGGSVRKQFVHALLCAHCCRTASQAAPGRRFQRFGIGVRSGYARREASSSGR